MASKFKKDQEVRQVIAPPPVMRVDRREIVGDEDMFFCQWEDAEGNTQERAFHEDDLEVVEVAPTV